MTRAAPVPVKKKSRISVRTDTPAEVHPCSFCGRVLKKKRYLREHKKTCLKNPQKKEQIVCAECSRVLSCERALYKHIQKSKNHHPVKESVSLSVRAHLNNKARNSTSESESLESLFEFSKKSGFIIPLRRLISDVDFTDSDERILLVNMQDFHAINVGENEVSVKLDRLGRDVLPDVDCGPVAVHFPYTRLLRMNPSIKFYNGFTALEVESQLRVLFNVMGSNDPLETVSCIEDGFKTVKNNIRDKINGNTARVLLEVFRMSYQKDKKFYCEETLFMGCKEAYHALFELGYQFDYAEQRLHPYVEKICKEHQGLKAIFLPVKVLVEGRAKWLLVYLRLAGPSSRKNKCLILDFDNFTGQTSEFRRINFEKLLKRFGNCFSRKTDQDCRQGWNFVWEKMFNVQQPPEHQHSGQRLVLTSALIHLAGFDRKPDSVMLNEIKDILLSGQNSSLELIKSIELELLNQAEVQAAYVDEKYTAGDSGMPHLNISSKEGKARTNINLYYHIRGPRQFWPRYISGSAKNYEF